MKAEEHKGMNRSDSRAGQRPPVVAALFADVPSAGEAVRELKHAGFREEQIGLVVREAEEPSKAQPTEPDQETRAGEEAVTGAAGGGVLGALTGLLVAMGVVVVPGLGPLLAGGALAGALGATGAAVVVGAGVGAAAGGLVGSLVGLNIPQAEAEQLAERVQAGHVLVTLEVGERVEEAMAILRRRGADVSVSGNRRTTRGTLLA